MPVRASSFHDPLASRRRSIIARSVRPSHRVSFIGLALLVAVSAAAPANAQAPRVEPIGVRPADRRLDPLLDLDGYFPFRVPESLEAWEVRRAEVRQRILVANALWPMPERGEVKGGRHGRIERDGYAVERVYFESLPGMFVTGSLYLPTGKPGPFPAVLSPHGHWADGRFYDAGADEAQRQIAAGAEEFVENARSPLQARCVHLARMGCVVFHYDMIGYADSQQISFDVAHRFAEQRPHLGSAEAWGLFSPRAESLLQSVMGLQTYHSLRALDFVERLPEVDPSRLAITGASGGGTQTFILSAIDDRLAASFPAVMVSTAMQGGCTCENCSLLRIGTGNVEFAALFAPKPLGLTAADDWTREMSTKGFPELQRLYAMYGRPENVELTNRLEFGHNYNAVGRKAMYSLFHRALGTDPPVAETEIERLTIEQMTVWTDEHPAPTGDQVGEAFETALLRRWDDEFRNRLQGAIDGSVETFRETIGKGAEVIVGRSLPAAGEVTWEATYKERRDGYLEFAGRLARPDRGETIPASFLLPDDWSGEVVLWFAPEGKSVLYGADGRPLSGVLQLVRSGAAVGSFDLFGQGEFVTAEDDFRTTRRVANPREAAAYTFGYNPSLAAQRAHDVLSAIGYVHHDRQHPAAERRLRVVGSGACGPIVALALSQANGAVHEAWLDTDGFRFADVDDLHDPMFLPGGARYLDLPGFLALAAPTRLHLRGEAGELPEFVARIHGASGSSVANERDLPALAPEVVVEVLQDAIGTPSR